MNKILFALLAVSITSFTATAQTIPSATSTTSVKASATLAAVCSISSQNVNFGQISLPVSAQSATSSMNVQCTKNSPYTIGLAYGGIYGTANTVQTQTGTTQTLQCIHVFWGKCDQYTTVSTPVYTTTTTYYAYGKMSGSSSGDTIAYSIQVPNQPSQVWNTGNYSYSSTGSGISQSIPIIATLLPSQTADSYPAADSYLDTVTATITY
jgi:spore coat protein U-like protein